MRCERVGLVNAVVPAVARATRPSSPAPAPAADADRVTLGADANTENLSRVLRQDGVTAQKLRDSIESFLTTLPQLADPAATREVAAAVQTMLDESDVLLSRNSKYIPMQLISTASKIQHVEKASDKLAALRAERLDSPVANFGDVKDGALYRGAQPSRNGLRWLAAHGVKTVVTLRQMQVEDGYSYLDFTSEQEAEECRRLGMRSISIPVVDMGLPTDAQVEQFLRLVDDPRNGPVFVHCAVGIGRTGVMSGIYERQQGTPNAQVADDLVRFGLNPRFPAARRQLEFVQGFKLPADATQGWMVAV